MSHLFQVYRLKKDDAALFVDKIAKVDNLTPITLHFVWSLRKDLSKIFEGQKIIKLEWKRDNWNAGFRGIVVTNIFYYM